MKHTETRVKKMKSEKKKKKNQDEKKKKSKFYINKTIENIYEFLFSNDWIPKLTG